MARDDEEIKRHIKQDLTNIADKLKRLAARFETCGFMPSIKRYALEIGRKSAELYTDIAIKVLPGDLISRDDGTVLQGETHYSLKPFDVLNLDEAYAKDLLQKVHVLTEETYLRNANPQKASIEMMKVANLIQKDLLKHEKDEDAHVLQSRKWEELDKLDQYLVERYNLWQQKLENDKKARFPSLRDIEEKLKKHPKIELELQLTQEGIRIRLKKLTKESWLAEYPYNRYAKRKTKESSCDPDYIEDMVDKGEAHPLK